MNYTLRNLPVAAALMILGILAVTSFIRSERQSLARGKQEIEVYVAAKDIPSGTPAKSLESGGYLKQQQVLREDAPPGVVSSLKELSKSDVVNDTIYEGQIVSTSSFNSAQGLNPTNQIRGNERLFTVPIPAANDVAGFIHPGDHVDISSSFAISGDGGNGVMTVMVARDIEVVGTPTSLMPKDQQKDAEQAPNAEGEMKLYVMKATDSEVRNIYFNLSASDKYGLHLTLRPANGATDSKLPPMAGPQKVRAPEATVRGANIPRDLGPDTSVD